MISSGSDITRTLDEASSKQLVAAYGVAVAAEIVVADAAAAADAAATIGFPVVAKLCGDAIAHKSERGLVRIGLASEAAVTDAAEQLLAAATPDDGEVGVLVARMISGHRELIAGLHRDEQFGLTVMVGVGGVLAEAVRDVAFRLAPLEAIDAEEMIADLAMQRLLGPFRGEPEVDRASLASVLLALSRLGEERSDVVSVDLNPLIISDGRPVAVDALVEVTS